MAEVPNQRFNLHDLVMVGPHPSWGMGEVLEVKFDQGRPHDNRPSAIVQGQPIYELYNGVAPSWLYLVRFQAPVARPSAPTLPSPEGEWIREQALQPGFQIEPNEHGAMIKLFMAQGVPFTMTATPETTEQQLVVGSTTLCFQDGKFQRVQYDVLQGEVERRL